MPLCAPSDHVSPASALGGRLFAYAYASYVHASFDSVLRVIILSFEYSRGELGGRGPGQHF